MPARLIVESEIDNSRQEISFDKPRITIGRKPGNDLHSTGLKFPEHMLHFCWKMIRIMFPI
jgi:hypothetical protein